MRRSVTWMILGPVALTGAAALGLFLWKRWGYPVQEIERDVPDVPEGPVADVPEPAASAKVQKAETMCSQRAARTCALGRPVERWTCPPEDGAVSG